EPGKEKPGEDKRTLVLGEGLVPLVGGDMPGWRSRPQPPGQPLTGVWRELAAWAAEPGGDSLTIADYDPGLRYLCLAAFSPGRSRLRVGIARDRPASAALGQRRAQ